MHLKRFSFRPKTKRGNIGKRSFKNKLESIIIKGMALGFALLVVFQMGSITDPVDFYLKIAGDVDYPAFQYEEIISPSETEGQNNQTIRLEFRAEPSAPVIIEQNEKTLGVIGSGITLEVKPGTVKLNASNVVYPVRVEVVLNEKSHYLDLNGDISSFDIQYKTN